MKTIQEVSLIAANWWADVICKPKYDNGDTGFNGFFASILGNMNTKQISEEQRNNFCNLLADKIEKLFTDDDFQSLYAYRVSDAFILDCDYSPCYLLAACAEESNIPKEQFPWKTSMWVGLTHISVRYGYGSEPAFLYETKAYWQSQIDSFLSSLERTKDPTYCSYIDDPIRKERCIKEDIAQYLKCIEEYKNKMDACAN